MNDSIYLLATLGFLAMYALPYLFFGRQGGLKRFNFQWWLTGSPFGISLLALILSRAGTLHPLFATGPTAARILSLAAVPFLSGALALMAATVATHRVPLALWHQQSDAPASIVTYGPYSMVRHPFYVSFIMLVIGTALITREAAGVAAIPLAIGILGWTARKEEKKLSASSFGAEYQAYLARTGRFFPRLGRSGDTTSSATLPAASAQ